LFFNRTATRSRGFTLIEVLVVIAITAIVLSSIYGIFTSISRVKDRLDDDSETYHRARVIFDRLGREIHGAYYNARNRDSRLRGGVNDENNFFLELSTTAVSPLSIEGTGFSLVSYVLEADPDSDQQDKILWRTERPLLTENQNDTAPRAMRLAPGIAFMQVRFYASGSWQENWDSASAGLPELVEIELRVSATDGVLVPFRTAFKLP